MWSSWTESAKSSLTLALEKTGDVISRTATDVGKAARSNDQQQQQPTIVSIPGLTTSTDSTTGSTTTTDSDGSTATSEETSTTAKQQQPSLLQSRMMNMMMMKGGSKHDVTTNVEGTTDTLMDDGTTTTGTNTGTTIMKNFVLGWNTVVETTKASVKVAEYKVKEQQQYIQQQLSKVRVSYYKRDPNLPLDVIALKDAEVVYITDRLITMGHPATASVTDIEITGERKLAAVGHLLNRRHDGRYMVWNISEVSYDVDILDDQVLTFSFPGSPSPPLGLLLKLLVSMESWLKADTRNVAVIHCLTGKGRTSTVLAAFLCWMGEAGFSDIYQALEYIAKCKQITPDELTIPSQRRYCSYFKNMLDGVHPSQPPLMLRRIIMSEAPKYAKGPTPKKKIVNDNGETVEVAEDDEEIIRKAMGCVPYIQLFKAGKLLHTAPATLNYQENENELPFCTIGDGSISFHVNQVVQGDILIRARHLTATRKRISMFRAAFHTGYVPPKVMRLTKLQLDGACIDERFASDFFLDLIFEPITTEEVSKLLLANQQQTTTTSNEEEGNTASATSTTATTGTTESTEGSPSPAVDIKPGSDAAAELMGGGNLVTASAYDTMLHRDSRFWDVINARKKLHDENQQQQQQQLQQQQTAASADGSVDAGTAASTTIAIVDPMVGKTIGRRRAFAGITVTSPEVAAKADAAIGALETFSIGGEFDFLPEIVHGESQGDNQRPATTTGSATTNTTTSTSTTGPPKKDHLMEALMGALEDEDVQMTPDHEVVVFDSHPEGVAFMPMAPILPTSTINNNNNTTPTDASSAPAPAPTVVTLPAKKDEQVTNTETVPSTTTTPTAATSAVPATDDVDALNAALLEVDDDLAAGAGGGAGGDDADVDYLNLDIDDAELEDLENFLSKT